MRRWIQKVFFCWSLLPAGMGVAAPTEPHLTISCGSTGIELQLCRSGVAAWSKKTGVKVDIFSTPNDSNERLALYQQLLGAKSKDIDIYQIDVVWPSLLGRHFIDLKTKLKESDRAAFVPATLENNTFQDRLTALPWFMDGGVFYYRKDLLAKYKLPVPRTWEQLEKTAKTILEKEAAAGNKDLLGFVFQGRAYEGLTCNALEWIASSGGGTLLDASGKPTMANPQAKQAVARIASWVGNIVPRGTLNYSEEESRGVFQSGKAIFMRNWPYAWALLNQKDSPVQGKVGVAALPSGTTETPTASTLGGWGLAISSYSSNPDLAADLVQFLTSEGEQVRRAVEGSFNPTRSALYTHPKVVAANPFLKELRDIFMNTVPRPARQAGNRYNQVSSEFWNAVHSSLEGRVPADQSLEDLQKSLTRKLSVPQG